MYTLNATTGAVTEGANAPFAASQLFGFLNKLVIAESSGNFVYVLKANSSGSDLVKNFYLDTFQVDTTPTLIPISSQLIDLAGTGSAVADPRGRGLALFVNQQTPSDVYPERCSTPLRSIRSPGCLCSIQAADRPSA